MAPLDPAPQVLRPFRDNTCPHCGGTLPTMAFCELACVRVPQRAGGDAFAPGRDADRGTPHLHKRCASCRYEWLSECKPDGVR